jgi:multidrug resistance efflux pump
MKKYQKYLLTGTVVVVAVAMVLLKYWDYVANPWTRDGQVQALVIQIAPRVSGPIINLPVSDNQFVKAGDVLFEIDPRTFEVSLAQARAQLDNTGNDVKALEKQVDAAKAGLKGAKTVIHQVKASIKATDAQIKKNRREHDRQEELLKRGAASQKTVDQAEADHKGSVEQRQKALATLLQAEATVLQAEADLAESKAKLGAIGNANAQVRAALESVRQAELDLEFTKVRAPVDGYVTNLSLQLGSQIVVNQPALALVDVGSYWVNGYFKENSIADIRIGDRAIVTLMSYPDTPLEGRVTGIAWGIAQQDGSTGYLLLPNVAATFEWIRLAQRVPVSIQLIDVPEDVALRVGTTASVLVQTGTALPQTK